MTQGLDLLFRSVSWWLDHPLRLLSMWLLWIVATGVVRMLLYSFLRGFTDVEKEEAE